MKHAMLLIAALSPLAGCSYLTTHVPALRPPANLTAECPPMEPAEVADMGDLLQVCVDDAALYRECRERHNQLAKWIRGEP